MRYPVAESRVAGRPTLKYEPCRRGRPERPLSSSDRLQQASPQSPVSATHQSPCRARSHLSRALRGMRAGFEGCSIWPTLIEAAVLRCSST